MITNNRQRVQDYIAKYKDKERLFMNNKIGIFIIMLLTLTLLYGCTDDSSDHDDHGGHNHGPSSGSHDDEQHQDEVTLTSEAITKWKIKSETISKHLLVETISVPARVSFNTEAMAHIGSVVSGRVSKIYVRIGDNVKAGDPLVSIVSPELSKSQSEYLQSRSMIATNEASLKVAKSLYERGKALYDDSKGIALSEVQRRESELRLAEGVLVAANSALKASENALHVLGMNESAITALKETGKVDYEYVINSPIDGQIITREITLGEAVGPDREALLVVANLTTLWVIADVPEHLIGHVNVGSKSTVTVPALKEGSFKGRVTLLGRQLNVSTRTVPVRIEIQDQTMLLRPGMFTQVEISKEKSENKAVIAIPEVAIQNIEGDTCVFVPVKGEPNTFAKQVVRIGTPVGKMVPVISGLKEGDMFVSNGSFILKADLGKAGAAHEH